MTRLRSGSGRIASLLAALVLPACTVGPNFVPPRASVSAHFWPKSPPPQTTTRVSVTAPQPLDPQWWNQFHDPELTALEGRLATENLDLATYLQRLAESRAQLGVAHADQLPTMQADGSYTRELPSAKGVLSLFSGGAGGGTATSFGSNGSIANGITGSQGGIPAVAAVPPFNLFQYGFDASWELDLWGHARREVEAARANVQAAEDQTRTVLVSDAAELARDYIQLRGVQQQIAIVTANVKAFDATLQLTQQRAAAGLSATLDVSNATAELASARSSVPALTAQQVALLNALCLLLGQEPGALDRELTGPGAIPPVPPVVPIGLPSELVRRRPDIRAAEARLHAATADVGVAVADFFPQISLTGSVGLQALQAKDLGNWGALQYGFGPTITLPIFQGGRLRATLALRRGQQQEAAIAYRQTVLAALGDVSTALGTYDQEQARRAQLQLAVDQNKRAVVLSTQRYREGLATFIEVLDAERQELSTQQQLADSTASVSTDLVAIYKALGGGWEMAAPEQVAER